MSENAPADANPAPSIAVNANSPSESAPAGTGAAAVPTESEIAAAQLRAQFEKGVGWFYWIGGLSIVNIALGFVGYKMVIGLGITELVDYLAHQSGSASIPLILLSVLISLGFMGLGVMGRKGKGGFIVAGLILYGLDAALLVMGEDWLSVAFHAYAGFHIFKGFQALREIVKGAKAAAA